MPGDYYRIVPDPYIRGSREHRTRFKQDENTSFMYLVHVKRVSLIVAPSVVSLRIYAGENAVCVGSGFILECNQQFETTILTSGTLFRGDNLKVVVSLPNRKIFLGQVEVCDFHFNLALVKIQADELLQPAELGRIKDSVRPGSKLIALGRYHHSIDDFMASYGEFSIQDCELNCKELLYSTCKIDKDGIGGPMINQEAQVVGVNFFATNSTPFLPINIVTRWLQHFKKYGECCRPWMGMGLFDLYVMKSCDLEIFFQKFPRLRKGVVVDEVTPNSPAGCAGIVSQDVILECDGEAVEGCLQMFDIIWDKVGKHIDLLIAKLDGSQRVLSVMVADVDPSQFNRWPSPTSQYDDFDDHINCPPLSVVLNLEGEKTTSQSNKGRDIIQRRLKSQSNKRRCIHMNLFKRLTFS